ncbi:12242_t:CDS:1 [Cetraspora pellucida]|uniref:12242_t:CDS:1 n=1 Tax=Cetraspora pellucida TaxID=1433469 RepID=A0A9N9NK36_9GLOM|nr:12242_t:CDS:1 [Cetraspora pellucida]
MKRQRNLYSIEEKRQAIELARCTSNIYAANYYSLDLTMLGRWVKLFSQGTPSKKNLRRVGSGRHAFFPEEEAQLYKWMKEVRQNGLAVTYSNLRIKMAKIMSKSSKQTKDETKKFAISNFKFSP